MKKIIFSILMTLSLPVMASEAVGACLDCDDHVNANSRDAIKQMKPVIDKALSKNCEQRLTQAYESEIQMKIDMYDQFIAKAEKTNSSNFMDVLRRRQYMEETRADLEEDGNISEAAMNEICRFNWEERGIYKEMFESNGVLSYAHISDYEQCDIKENPDIQGDIFFSPLTTGGGFQMESEKLMVDPQDKKDMGTLKVALHTAKDFKMNKSTSFKDILAAGKKRELTLSFSVFRNGSDVLQKIEGKNVKEFAAKMAKLSCAPAKKNKSHSL